MEICCARYNLRIRHRRGIFSFNRAGVYRISRRRRKQKTGASCGRSPPIRRRGVGGSGSPRTLRFTRRRLSPWQRSLLHQVQFFKQSGSIGFDSGINVSINRTRKNIQLFFEPFGGLIIYGKTFDFHRP